MEAVSRVAVVAETESSLLLDGGDGGRYVDGVVDYKGRPVVRSRSGGWRSAFFIIGVEVVERFAYNGINSNLISYLTGPLGQSKAIAAENVNTWAGVAMVLPLLGAFVADSFLGRYRTIVISSVIYTLGLCLLTLSAVLTTVTSLDCESALNIMPCSQPKYQILLFFFSLYLVAFGQGGHKPCAEAFGADQFDENNTEEQKAKSSFFNWWYLGVSIGTTSAFLILNYIQDNVTWALGFGIPCISMVVALVIFLIGTRTYRLCTKDRNKNPFLRIGNVFINAARNWRTSASITNEEDGHGVLTHRNSPQYKFLDKALIEKDGPDEELYVADVQDAKTVLGLVPIWIMCLPYAIIFAQCTTFFTVQGRTMDRSVWLDFDIPAASLQLFTGVPIFIFIPIYDRVFVPSVRALTGEPSGITMLQRIGAGLFASIVCMIVSALVEMKRLEVAREYGLVDHPGVTIPMSFWWLVPQYVLLGIADVFAIVGMQEFFYDQVPNDLKSVGLSIYLSVLGTGSFLSSFLVSVIENATGGEGRNSWFSDNLNRAHLDYFYWLLAAISTVGLLGYMYFTKYYIYRRER